jgi:threonine/homoserine/homoserine lactone efflux protein
MNDLAVLLGFWTAFGLVLISPGPNFAVLLTTSVSHGRRRAVEVAVGMVLGEIVWGLAAVFGIAALVAHSPSLILLLRISGGLYLLWLAYAALRSAGRGPGHTEAIVSRDDRSGTPTGGTARGFLLMLLNAKAGFFWISLTTIVLGPGRSLQTGLLAVAGAVLLSATWHGLLAYAFTLPRVLRAYERARRGLEAVLGTVLAALGLKVLAAW